jgi:hypothetical protein
MSTLRVLTRRIVKLEKLDEYCQHTMITANAKATTRVVWASQHSHPKTFSLGDQLLWFPKGHKEHKSKFKK